MTTTKSIPCTKCNTSKPIPEFYQCTLFKNGTGECKCCVRARVNKSHKADHRVAYYNTDVYKSIHAKGFQDYSAKNPIKIAARKHVSNAIERGDLIRADNCECCNADSNKVMIEAHHCDYSKPLEVNWLCTRCHTDWHNDVNNKATGG